MSFQYIFFFFAPMQSPDLQVHVSGSPGFSNKCVQVPLVFQCNYPIKIYCDMIYIYSQNECKIIEKFVLLICVIAYNIFIMCNIITFLLCVISIKFEIMLATSSTKNIFMQIYIFLDIYKKISKNKKNTNQYVAFYLPANFHRISVSKIKLYTFYQTTHVLQKKYGYIHLVQFLQIEPTSIKHVKQTSPCRKLLSYQFRHI